MNVSGKSVAGCAGCEVLLEASAIYGQVRDKDLRVVAVGPLFCI